MRNIKQFHLPNAFYDDCGEWPVDDWEDILQKINQYLQQVADESNDEDVPQ